MNAATRFLSGCLLSVTLAFSAGAQTVSEPGNVMLVADHVYVSGDSVLTARGHVEALMDDMRLLATEIVYDANADKITLSGPIRIIQGDEVTILASSAELDSAFNNGLLRSARMVLNQQVQLASNQLNRVDGRYSVLSKTTASSCRICESGEPPLWQIRAKRVVHDQLERQIYFDHASLLIRDVPVLYFPHLRLPDPTLDRATGFLIPTVRTTSQLSYGLKMPYFITLGNHRDITLTPYISSETKTLEFRYRQAFKKGRIELNGAVSDDTILPNKTRGYLFAEGRFDLPRDFQLSFDLKAVSDDSYITDYDYSDDDRLVSNITAQRSYRDEATRVALLHYQSLRPNEDNDLLPTLVAVATTERRFFPSSIGGEVRTNVELHGHQRRSNVDQDGRDVGRAHADVSWRRNWILPSGVRTGVTGELAFDAFHTHNDSRYPSYTSQLAPTLAAHIRYPMSKIGADGATYIIEPVAQLAWTGGDNLDVENDESTRVEFDEGNLLALSRFPSYDRRERGLVGAIGFNWSRYSPDSWQSNFTIGQVFHEEDQIDFSNTSGLSGFTSDLLLAGQIKARNGLSLTARTIYDYNAGIKKADARIGWNNNKLWLDGRYVWLAPDVQEDRTSTLSEWVLDSRYRLGRHWTGLFDWRYDAGSNKTAESGIGLEYRNECVKVELSVSRRFSTSTTVQSNTSFGLTVALLGFSVKSNQKSYDRTCG